MHCVFFTCRFQCDFIEFGPISHRIRFFIIIFTLNKLTTNLIFDVVYGRCVCVFFLFVSKAH